MPDARLIVLGVALAVAAPAQAHRPEPNRALVLQADDEGLGCLWTATIDGGAADLLRLRYDVDRDGALSATEAEQAAQAVVLKAMHGVRLRVDGRPAPAADVRVRLAQEGPAAMRGPLTALALLRLAGNPAPGTRVAIEVLVDQGESLGWAAQALPPWTVAASAGPSDAVHLRRGERRGVIYELAPAGP